MGGGGWGGGSRGTRQNYKLLEKSTETALKPQLLPFLFVPFYSPSAEQYTYLCIKCTAQNSMLVSQNI